MGKMVRNYALGVIGAPALLGVMAPAPAAHAAGGHFPEKQATSGKSVRMHAGCSGHTAVKLKGNFRSGHNTQSVEFFWANRTGNKACIGTDKAFSSLIASRLRIRIYNGSGDKVFSHRYAPNTSSHNPFQWSIGIHKSWAEPVKQCFAFQWASGGTWKTVNKPLCKSVG
jgi:hypothetical protein